jgi:hypothetical protein
VNRNRLLWLLHVLAWVLLPAAPVHAQVTITFTFSNGTVADADQVNANFTVLGSQALNRTGGTITGNITVAGGVTIDGVDVGVQACTTCTPTFSTLTLSSIGASALDVAGGINAGSGNVGIVDATGKIPALTSGFFTSLAFDAANLTGTAAAINGSAITALNASQLTTGTVPDARISGTYSSAITLSNAGNALTGTHTGSGAALTALNATQLTSGTLPDARFSGTYTNALTFSGTVSITNALSSLRGSHLSSDGSTGITGSCNFTTGLITVKNGLVMTCPP